MNFREEKVELDEQGAVIFSYAASPEDGTDMGAADLSVSSNKARPNSSAAASQLFWPLAHACQAFALHDESA